MGDVIGSAIEIGGSLLGGSKANESASKAASSSYGAELAAAQKQHQWNRDDAIWARDQNAGITKTNQKAMDEALRDNRINQSSNFGSLQWVQGPNGMWEQKSYLAPRLWDMLGTLRTKQGKMIGGMETGFNVNNSVMQAMRALQQPELQKSRDMENARLAAMGLSTGSGSAWGNAQNVLNKAASEADLQAILAGQTAWLQNQQNMRSNLAGLNATESGWQANSQMPSYALATAAQQGQVGTSAAPSTSGWAQTANNAANAASQATGQGWANASQGLGDLAQSAWNSYNASQGLGDLAQSAWNSYNSPATTSGSSWGASSAYDPWSSSSYSLGSW